MLVGSVLPQIRTINVIRPHRRESADIPRHPGHESRHQRRDSQPQQSRSAITRQHERQNIVISELPRLRFAAWDKMHR